ncbi:MAG: hypothetical protein JOZ62_13195 [Acidobacteriaceae bacterium]|nr:hypothetical protein [Acidobacteriaceae bacterium]
MTTRQLYLFSSLYLFMLIAVASVTRATPRRIAGSLAGAGAAGVLALGIIELGERTGWWHMQITWEPYFLLLLWIDIVLCAYVFLITWRIPRRFGGRGLAVLIVAAAVIGPARDYWYMQRFPEWGSYAQGAAPVLAISASYVLLLLVGHGVMRLVAGPANEDRLTRQWWKTS